MRKPYIFAVDDDPAVLKAVERDLRSRYANRYRILTAGAPDQALQVTEQLTGRGDEVALFLVDQRMPGMSGTEFLAGAMKAQPHAQRALLTAYADSSAAIDAINRVGVKHYFVKPWVPPEEHFYPVLDELLEEWSNARPETFEGAYVLGTRWSPETHRIKDFLARSQYPYRWVEPDAPREPRLAAALNGKTIEFPAVVLPDGSALSRPANGDLAARLGLQMAAQAPFYDVIIIGAGPAGLACALYCSTEGLSTLLLEREAAGGQAALSSRIENYLGFPSGLSGADLARRAIAQVKRFGTEVLAPAEAVGLRQNGDYKIVRLAGGQEISAHSVVIAAGVRWRKLEIPGMDRLAGAGIYYGAAITEAESCRGEDVYIVGGANSAGQAAVHFSTIARRVRMIVRAESLSKSMSHYLSERIATIDNIEVIPNAEVVAVEGAERLERLTIRRQDLGTEETVPATALFVFIGAEPHTDWLEGVVQRDEKGFLATGQNVRRGPGGWTLPRAPYLLETSIPGIFSVGDVRDSAVRRVANSVGEGSIVLYFIRQYMRQR